MHPFLPVSQANDCSLRLAPRDIIIWIRISNRVHWPCETPSRLHSSNRGGRRRAFVQLAGYGIRGRRGPREASVGPRGPHVRTVQATTRETARPLSSSSSVVASHVSDSHAIATTTSTHIRRRARAAGVRGSTAGRDESASGRAALQVCVGCPAPASARYDVMMDRYGTVRRPEENSCG